MRRQAPPEPSPSALPPARAASDSAASLATLVGTVFERVLRCEGVGWDDDFFDLGGDSILAIAVMLELAELTDRELPLTAIYDHPTPRAIGRLLRGAEPRRSCLVLLKPGNSAAPLYLVHGLGGSPMELRGLAYRIDRPEPVYGIRARGLDGTEPPLDRVDAMARSYVDELTRSRPSGRYLLAGFSFGGLVALEMARLLALEGHDVPVVVLLDTITHSSRWSLRCRLSSWREILAQQASLALWGRVGRHYIGALRGLSPGAAARFLATRAGRALRYPFDLFRLGALVHRFADPDGAASVPGLLHGIAPPVEMRRVADAGYAAFRHYRPRPYDGEIVYVKAAAAGRMPFSAELMWGRTSPRLKVHLVPGDHWGLIKDGAGAVAAILAACVRSAAGRDGTGMRDDAS